MIISCIVALVPFIMAFLVFVLVFSVCYVVLELELGMDESEAKALPFFCKMVL
jgi:p-aminobenzoyl-glutamate transporter AbgT